MGTSGSYKGGVGGAWTPYKRAASAYARYGGPERAGAALAAFVAALGGVAGALAAAQPGLSAGGGLGQLLAASAVDGSLSAGVGAVGLGDLVGGTRIELLGALLDRFTGDGASLNDQAARSAMVDTLNDLLPDGDDALPLDDVHLDEAAVRALIEKYLALLIYNLAAPIIDERLNRLGDLAVAAERNRELQDYILALVRLAAAQMNPLTVDWSGEEGQRILRTVLEAVYEQLDAEDH